MEKKIILVLFLFAFLFSISAAAESSSLFGETSSKSIFSDETKVSDKEESIRSSISEKKSIFDEDATILDNGDNKLQAPPTFDDDDGQYNPGGQVSPKLPLTDFYPLAYLFLLYTGGKLMYLRYRKNQKC